MVIWRGITASGLQAPFQIGHTVSHCGSVSM
jgi:hypothetical protein